MVYKFAFVSVWKCQIYDKLANYIKYIFQQCHMPHIVVETPADLRTYVYDHPEERIIVVYMFSYINMYTMPVGDVEYLMFVLDPKHNLETAFSGHLDAICRVVYGFVTLTTIQDDYFKQHWPDKPVFHLFQGYVPYEDIKYQINVEKPVDVVAPGFEGFYAESKDRMEVVQKLRNRGLIVNDKKAFGVDMDNAIQQAKVYIYYPFDKRYVTWHGQRTLWAVNKQICVVTTVSEDKTCEEFYSKGIYIHAPWDIDQFVDVVVDVVRSGRWKQIGKDNYKCYKQKYDGSKLFQQSSFYHYWRNLSLVVSYFSHHI